jgi:hypothetical protein
MDTLLRKLIPMPAFDGDPAPAPAPGGGDPPPANPAPPGPAASTLNPAPPAPAAFPLTNITDPGQVELLRTKGWVSQDGAVDVAQLAQGYYNANRMISGDNPQVVRMPDPQTATSDDWAKFHRSLGAPENAEGYELQFDSQGVPVAEDVVTASRSAFHEAGLTPRQAQIMAKHMQTVAGKQAEAAAGQKAQSTAEEVAALQQEWNGQNGAGSWDQNIAAGQQAFRALGLDSGTVDAIEGQMGFAPLMKLMAAIGRGMPGEGVVPGGQGGGNADPSQMTPQMAQAEIDRLHADKDFQEKYLNNMNPEHKAAVQRMSALYARVTQGRKAG